METILINLTKNQKDTLSALKEGKYDTIKMANVTRLLKKIITNDELSRVVIPKVIQYQMKIHGKQDETEVKKDLMKRLKDFPNKSIINRIIDARDKVIDQESTDIKPIDSDKSKKPQFDTSQDLDSLLDDLVKPKKKLGEDGAGRPPPAIQMDEEGVANARRKMLGEDGAGRPPIPQRSDDSEMAQQRKPKLMAMSRGIQPDLTQAQKNKFEGISNRMKQKMEDNEIAQDQLRMSNKPKAMAKLGGIFGKKKPVQEYEDPYDTTYDEKPLSKAQQKVRERANAMKRIIEDKERAERDARPINQAKRKIKDTARTAHYKVTEAGKQASEKMSEMLEKFDYAVGSKRVEDREAYEAEMFRLATYPYLQERGINPFEEGQKFNLTNRMKREIREDAKHNEKLIKEYNKNWKPGDVMPKWETKVPIYSGKEPAGAFGFKPQKNAPEPPQRPAGAPKNKDDRSSGSGYIPPDVVPSGAPTGAPTGAPSGRQPDVPSGKEPAVPKDKKESSWRDQDEHKEEHLGDGKLTHRKGGYPAGASNPTALDEANGKPVDMKQFMERNGRSGMPSKEDVEYYTNYINSFQASIDDFKATWAKTQENIAKNRERVRNGEIPRGAKYDNSNDPFHMLRAMGYEYESDLDGSEAMGIAVSSVFHYAGDVAGMIPGLGLVAGPALRAFGDVWGMFSAWTVDVAQRRDYYYRRFDASDLEMGIYDPETDTVYRRRQDKYYRPHWSKYKTYLPNELDPYGEPDPYFAGQQAVYLSPLKKYTNLFNEASDQFLDTMSQSQLDYLKGLGELVRNMELGYTNITHKQYMDLLKETIGAFTDAQRQDPFISDKEQFVVDAVKSIYTYGADQTDADVQGGLPPFADDFIKQINDAHNKKQADNYPDEDDEFDDDDEDYEDEGDEGDEGDEEDEPDEGDDKDVPDKPNGPPSGPPARNPNDVREHPWAVDFGHEPKYRPRGQWGGTDELFAITDSEKQKRNLIIESSTLNEGIDRTNPFYKRQQIEYDMRYRNTFPMVRGESPFIPRVSDAYNKANRSIWISQRVPINRAMENSMRDAYDWGQYQNFQPKYDYDSARGSSMTNTNNFPSVADSLTQGQNNIVMPMRSYEQQIMNQRWTR